MTTSKITISLVDSDVIEHGADYFQYEDGWVTLKTVEGRQVAAYPAARVAGIETTLGPVTAAEQEAILNGVTVTKDVSHRTVNIRFSEEGLRARGFVNVEDVESKLREFFLGAY